MKRGRQLPAPSSYPASCRPPSAGPGALGKRGVDAAPGKQEERAVRSWAAATSLLLAALAPPAGAAEAGAGGMPMPAAALAELACPKCHHVNRPTARFCGECGTLLHPGDCPRC